MSRRNLFVSRDVIAGIIKEEILTPPCKACKSKPGRIIHVKKRSEFLSLFERRNTPTNFSSTSQRYLTCLKWEGGNK